jgi:hypothetical protein
MENLHLKNLDLTKVYEQLKKNKLKSILEINNEIAKMFNDDEDLNTKNDKKERKSFLNLDRYFM